MRTEEDRMNDRELTPAEAKEGAEKTLEVVPFVALGTCGTDGWPDVRMMAVAAREGVETLWFGTSKETKKIAQLKANPKTVIYGFDPATMREFRLFGRVEMRTDAESRRKVWRDEFLRYFPEGVDSPTLVVLRFVTEHGEYASLGEGMGKFCQGSEGVKE